MSAAREAAEDWYSEEEIARWEEAQGIDARWLAAQLNAAFRKGQQIGTGAEYRLAEITRERDEAREAAREFHKLKFFPTGQCEESDYERWPLARRINMTFREIADYLDYRVSTSGKVESRRRTGSWVPLRPYVRDGYQGVTLCNDNGERDAYIHTLVLEAFVGPRPPGMQCRHFPDGTKTNNDVTNLSWGTIEQNNGDKIHQGTAPKGEQNAAAILTEAKVKTIRELYASNSYTQAELAKQFGVKPPTIGDLLRRKTWKHVG